MEIIPKTAIHPESTARAGRRLGLALGLAALLAACAPNRIVRGYVPDEALLTQIKPGVQTTEQVTNILGSPSAKATFEGEQMRWYYITRRTESVTVFDEELVDQTVVTVDFDEAGVVTNVVKVKKTKDELPVVQVVERETPTQGRSLTFLQQMFGNFGNFGRAVGGAPSGVGGPGSGRSPGSY